MNNELYHYGVPGMRWGKRKRNRADRMLDKSRRAKSKGDVKNASKYSKKADKIKRRNAQYTKNAKELSQEAAKQAPFTGMYTTVEGQYSRLYTRAAKKGTHVAEEFLKSTAINFATPIAIAAGVQGISYMQSGRAKQDANYMKDIAKNKINDVRYGYRYKPKFDRDIVSDIII